MMYKNRRWNLYLKIIKTNLKRYFKIALYTLINLQLCFMPCYGYAQTETGAGTEAGTYLDLYEDRGSAPTQQEMSSIQGIWDRVRDNSEQQRATMDPQAVKQLDRMTALATAIETDEIDQYMQENPRIRQEMDYFLLVDQRAESLEYHIDSETGEVAEKVSHTVELNDYKSGPLHTVFKSVRIRYDKNSRELIFEGVTADQVMLRQYIPNMDIIGYTNDNEMLILLDRKKGLLLADMFFARAYLGLAPVSFTRIPSPVLKTIMRRRGTIVLDSIKLEFINRTVRPPDKIPNGLNIDENFAKEHLFKAGDFMVSYMDQEGHKRILQFFKRTELAGWMKLTYNVLDIMMKVVAPHLMKKEDIELLAEELSDIKNKPVVVLERVLSALFTKNALYKLTQAADGMQSRVGQLDAEELSAKDTMLFQEWKEYFDKTTSKLRVLHSEMETQNENKRINFTKKTFPNLKDMDQEDRKNIASDVLDSQSSEQQEFKGSRLSTQVIQAIYELPEMSEQRNIRTKALKIMAGITKVNAVKYGIQGLDFVNKHRVSTLAGVGTAAGFVFPEKFLLLVNEVLPLFNHFHHTASNAIYSFTSAPNLVTMTAFLPGLVILLSYTSIPFLKGLQKVLPKNISIAGKVRHPRGYVQDIVNKWGETTISQRIVGVGMKFVAYTIYPFWNYLFQAVGQPHFFSAIAKGLNPFQEIKPHSDIGQMAQLTKNTRLGTQGWNPQWRQNGKFKKPAGIAKYSYDKTTQDAKCGLVDGQSGCSGKRTGEP